MLELTGSTAAVCLAAGAVCLAAAVVCFAAAAVCLAAAAAFAAGFLPCCEYLDILYKKIYLQNRAYIHTSS